MRSSQAEIRTCNLPIANPALYHTATSAPVYRDPAGFPSSRPTDLALSLVSDDLERGRSFHAYYSPLRYTGVARDLVISSFIHSFIHLFAMKQEAQLMLTNQRGAFRGQSR